LRTENTNIDLSRYVALGDSLTSGYKDGALFYEGQMFCYPKLLAEQFQTKFHQALMPKDSVGIGFFANSRLVLTKESEGLSSKISYLANNGDTQALLQNIYSQSGPFNNLGVPGAKATTLLVPGYGDKNKGESNYNVFFSRMTSDPINASILSDAMKIDPTFFSLFIGNNDVMAYALSGGTMDAITPTAGTPGYGFEESMTMIIKTLVSHGAKGVLSNLPSVHCIPFFNTIHYNDLLLDEDGARALNELHPKEGIGFHAGRNLFLAEDTSRKNGKRLIEKGEMILLEILLDENKSDYLRGIKPVPKKYYLSLKQIQYIENALNAFNAIIKNLAGKYKLALVDADRLLRAMKENRIYNPVLMNVKYKSRDVFSLDGLHINKLGQALLANEFIKAINYTYGTHINKLNLTQFREKRNR
jgi:lysophospholipase L1-like esterase